MNSGRKSYPSDVGEEEWNFCVGYLTLMNEAVPQREYSWREVLQCVAVFCSHRRSLANAAA